MNMQVYSCSEYNPWDCGILIRPQGSDTCLWPSEPSIGTKSGLESLEHFLVCADNEDLYGYHLYEDYKFEYSDEKVELILECEGDGELIFKILKAMKLVGL